MDELARLTVGLDGPESALLRERLWALLERQVARATQGDATSLPVERAEALFASLCYTLGVWLEEAALPPQALLRGDPDDALRAGWALLERQTAEAAALYREAVATAPPYANRALRDTLRGIAPFFRRYDWRLAAHQLPAEIDYPLCHPVPEALQGVSYLRAYLRRLLAENRLLARCEPALAEALLTRYYGAYDAPLVNLYEPVAACAVGLALVGGEPTALRFAPEQRECLAAVLTDAAEPITALRAAAARAANALALPPGDDGLYLADWAECLWPRAVAALPAGALHGVFACG